jgi:hypothetical protein
MNVCACFTEMKSNVHTLQLPKLFHLFSSPPEIVKEDIEFIIFLRFPEGVKLYSQINYFLSQPSVLTKRNIYFKGLTTQKAQKSSKKLKTQKNSIKAAS